VDAVQLGIWVHFQLTYGDKIRAYLAEHPELVTSNTAQTYNTIEEAIQHEIIDALAADDMVTADPWAEFDIDAIANATLGDSEQGYACQVDPNKFWQTVVDNVIPKNASTKRQRISRLELRARREALGLTREQLADIWGNAATTLRGWELGKDPVPYRIPNDLTRIEVETTRQVEYLAQLASNEAVSLGAIDDWSAKAIDRAQQAIRQYGMRWWRTCCARAYNGHPIPEQLLTIPESWQTSPED